MVRRHERCGQQGCWGGRLVAQRGGSVCLNRSRSLYKWISAFRVISPTGIIGFHNTASSAALLGLRADGENSTLGLEPVLSRAGREWELYVARDVSFDLLFEPQVRIETLCTAPRSQRATSGERVIDIVSVLDFWIPSPGALTEFGISYEGQVALSEREAAWRFHACMSEKIPAPKFTSESRKLPVESEMLLYSIEACSVTPICTLSATSAPPAQCVDFLANGPGRSSLRRFIG
jgi:hypothetical protein